ncbi:MAG: hypothetical protein P8Y43_05045 [Sulfurovaceae bacterium]
MRRYYFLPIFFIPSFLFAYVTAEGAVYFLSALGAVFLFVPYLKYLVVNYFFKIHSKKLYHFYLIGLLEVVCMMLIFGTFDDGAMILIYALSTFAINLLYFSLNEYRLNLYFVLKVSLLSLLTPLVFFVIFMSLMPLFVNFAQ